MFLSRIARLPRKPFIELDYARHMPKSYVEDMKRTVPRKVFGRRFGAPPITRWVVHPDDYVPTFERPWLTTVLPKTLDRANLYKQKKLANKYFEIRHPKISRIPDDKWTFFPGDMVQVNVGKDKGRQGTVLSISRETNEVLVEGMHTKLENMTEDSNKSILNNAKRWKEQPLSVEKGHVSLVDPNDGEPCTAKWILNKAEDEYIRVSKRSGYEIPIPVQAEITYDYVQPAKYLEVEEKDTPSKDVLLRTYKPKLLSFEQEIMESMGIKDDRKPGPTYWY